MLFPVSRSCSSIGVKKQQPIGEADFMFTHPLMSFGAKFRFIEHCFVREYLRDARGDLSINSVVIIFLSFTMSFDQKASFCVSRRSQSNESERNITRTPIVRLFFDWFGNRT